jgi:hypothetical protein
MAGNPTQLSVAHVFGMNPEAGLELADSNVLVSVCGNGLHFSSTNKSSRSVFLWGTGTGISAFAVCRRVRLLAFAERGVSPRLYVHDLVTHELVRLPPAARGMRPPDGQRDGRGGRTHRVVYWWVIRARWRGDLPARARPKLLAPQLTEASLTPGAPLPRSLPP